ncbi:MAG TPA: hypothetical protein VLE70_06555 [Anaerolineae bacterium]|nr:hypothetical protein [Anaerolineae bacterium]
MTSNPLPEQRLQPLFEVKLNYVEGKPAVSMDGKVGEYLGSGEGTVTGVRLNGVVHWTLFEAQRETACESNLFGIITTEDEAEIRFDTMGFFRRPYKDKPHLWVTSAAVSFETDDERYTWPNPILGVWEGTFDMSSYKHHYQAYAREL